MGVFPNAIPWKAFIYHLLCVGYHAKFLLVLPHFIFINHLHKVGITLPILQILKLSSVRLGNLPNELVSQVYLPQQVLQSQGTYKITTLSIDNRNRKQGCASQYTSNKAKGSSLQYHVVRQFRVHSVKVSHHGDRIGRTSRKPLLRLGQKSLRVCSISKPSTNWRGKCYLSGQQGRLKCRQN